MSLNVEGCHRLYGSPSAVPPGFDSLQQQSTRRPGMISRLPPDAEEAGASSDNTCNPVVAGGTAVQEGSSDSSTGSCS